MLNTATPSLRPCILGSLALHLALIGGVIFVHFSGTHTLQGRPGRFLGYVSLVQGFGDGGAKKPVAAAPKRAAPKTAAMDRNQIPAGAQTQEAAPAAESLQAGTFGTGIGIGSGAGGGGEGGNGGDIADERYLRIRTQIEKAKIYPMLAIRQGISGTVLVRFKIDEQGKVQTAEILRSSGSDLLDHATLKTLERAAPYPTVAGWISFPLRYDLAMAQGNNP